MNLPLSKLITSDLCLIIKIIDKRESLSLGSSCDLIDIGSQKAIHRHAIGYSVLPLSKLLWYEGCRVSTIYQVDAASIIKAPEDN